MPPVARRDTTCWRRMSIRFRGGASAGFVGGWLGSPAAAPHTAPPDPPTAPEGAGALAVSLSFHCAWGSVAEVGAADGVVATQIGRRAGHDDAAGLEEIRVVREIESDGGVLLDEEHAHAF